MKQVRIYFLVLFIISCNNDDSNDTNIDDNNESESVDLIVGTWTELGQGSVSDNGTDQFSEYDYFCVTLGRFSFTEDGNFRIETFDGPDDGCFSTGILTGTWVNQGESYLFKVDTDSSDEPLTGQQVDINIEFPDENKMRWIFQSESEGIDYSYEDYVRLE